MTPKVSIIILAILIIVGIAFLFYLISLSEEATPADIPVRTQGGIAVPKAKERAELESEKQFQETINKEDYKSEISGEQSQQKEVDDLLGANQEKKPEPVADPIIEERELDESVAGDLDDIEENDSKKTEETQITKPKAPEVSQEEINRLLNP